MSTVSLATTALPDPKDRWFYQRQSTSYGYTATLILWFTIFFWSLVTIPYLYDQHNQREYSEASDSKTLIFREFHSAQPTPEEEASCLQALKRPCRELEVYSRRKLIALDYVGQLKNVSPLSFLNFVIYVFPAYAFIALSFGLVDRFLSYSPVASFVCIATFFFAMIMYMGLSATLPHNNIKFYFVMGSVYALLLPTMDYLHRTPALISFPVDASAQYKSDMMKLAYSRWSQALGAGLTFSIAVVATVSFNLLSYLTQTFGESFTLYPLVGIITALAFAIAGFLWGVLRNISVILVEIEQKILELR